MRANFSRHVEASICFVKQCNFRSKTAWYFAKQGTDLAVRAVFDSRMCYKFLFHSISFVLFCFVSFRFAEYRKPFEGIKREYGSFNKLGKVKETTVSTRQSSQSGKYNDLVD